MEILVYKKNTQRRNGDESMTEFLIRESLSPRVFLNVLRILLNNGFTSLQYISYKNQKVFQQKLLWNTQHAIDLTPSEDSFGLLGKHIKSQFFKLGGNMNYRTITFPKNS